MSFIVPEPIEAYAVACTSELHPIYEALRAVTYAETDAPQMQVGPLEGRFLKTLVQLMDAKTVVEIGTFTGYSALSMAEGMSEGGRLYTCDINETTGAIAQSHFDRVPWGAKITRLMGPALTTLAHVPGPVDLAFIDADKGNYTAYFEALVPRMRQGGLIVADNVLWSGKVLEPAAGDVDTQALVAFSQHVKADPRVEQVMLTVRDGMTLARVK